jgi:alpha-amylase
MWIMVDIVANHAGCLQNGATYADVEPFNKEEHYHSECYIDNWNDQWEVENCRLACLIDLKQEDEWVADTIKKWVISLVEDYEIDGFRIDTIPEVPKWYWSDFNNAHGVYAVGEVFNGDIGYVADYQNHVPGLLNYPIWYTTLGTFGYGDSMFKIRDTLDQCRATFKDTNALGVFNDNHDNERFLNRNSDWQAVKSMTAFSMFMEGIPIFYYGTEQGFHGGDDPDNREPLWTSMNTDHEIYKFTSTLVHARKAAKVWEHEHIERFVETDFYAFSRGDALMALTNGHDQAKYTVGFHPYEKGKTVCNVFNTSDCLTVTDKGLEITLNDYEVKIYVPQAQENEVTE